MECLENNKNNNLLLKMDDPNNNNNSNNNSIDDNDITNKRKLNNKYTEIEDNGANLKQDNIITKKQCTTNNNNTTTNNNTFKPTTTTNTRVISNLLVVKILKYSIKLATVDNQHGEFIETISIICKSWNLFILPKLNLPRFQFKNDDYLYTYLKVQDMCKELLNRTTPTPEYELAGNQSLEGLLNSLFVSPFSFGVHEFKLENKKPQPTTATNNGEQQQQQEGKEQQSQEGEEEGDPEININSEAITTLKSNDNTEHKELLPEKVIDYSIYVDGKECGSIFSPDIDTLIKLSNEIYTNDERLGTKKGLSIALSRLKIPAFEVYGERDPLFYKDQVYHSAQTNFTMVLNKMHISIEGEENNLQITPDNGDLVSNYVGSFVMSLGIDAYEGGEIVITGNDGSLDEGKKTTTYKIESCQSFTKRNELYEQIQELEQIQQNLQANYQLNPNDQTSLLQQQSIQTRIAQLEEQAKIQIIHFKWVAFYQGCVAQKLLPVTMGSRVLLHFNVNFNHLEKEEDFKIIKDVANRIRVSGEGNYQHPENENSTEQVKEIINFSNENQFLKLNAYDNRTFNNSNYVLCQVPIILEKIINLEMSKNKDPTIHGINVGIVLNNLYKSSNISEGRKKHFHQLQDFDRIVFSKLIDHFGSDRVKLCSFLIHYPKPIVPNEDDEEEQPPQNPDDLKPRIEMINSKIVSGFNKAMKNTKTLLFLSASKHLDLKSIHSKPITSNDVQDFEEVGCFSSILVLSKSK